ncbi:heterokaryon incompatibility protein 6, OR allele [Colletotrichum spaethianum]|uniref:Heterokaryon incompatibility protein 6, OR allele n=1 Tax=Colletotrichum spaethianum TaxID=700344 RepID=A0AA37P631_9PEZI|nr:heterokaryon incompatibility protein 6, OR allele [Colletotrichum spaethianum]GKT45351.1 heterokaryon incompatibility protein 6, OR allele [Colletotrichum spaethianum]
MAEYKYAAIGERDFRILSLSPGKFDEPLYGELLVRPIDTYIDEASKHEGELPESADSYEAISYVWGSEDKPKRITSPAGADIAITENLCHCLRRIRLADRPRLVWVDALCINQSDNKEKESQIMLMHDIYVSARRVLAYLGEEADGSKEAIELIEKYWRVNIPNPLNAGARAFVENLLSEPVPDAPTGSEAELPPQGDEKWMAVSRFWNRSWFRRVWVVQEFILARDVLMICGDKTVSWSQLWPATVALEEPESPPWPLINAAGEEIEGAADLMANMAQRLRFYQLGSMRGNSDGHGHGDEDGHDHGHEHGGGCCGGHGGHEHEEAEDAEGEDGEWESEDEDDSDRSTDLLSLLLSFREVEATDPRDLYFALLGLASDGDREEFRPDYSATFEQTALRFGRTLLHEPFSEELLDHAGIAENLNGKNFPSWIPDFRRPWRRMTVADAAESEAAGETDFDFGFDPNEDEDVLLLKGVKVDTISHMTGVPRPAHLHAEQPSLWVKRDMVTLSKLLANIPNFDKTTYPTGESGLEAVLRALTFFRTEADEDEVPMTTLKLAYRFCTAVEEDDLSATRPEREALRKEIMLSGCTAEEAGEALEAAAQVLINRVFPMRAALDLVLAKGEKYVGMVPDGCEAGDEIWVMKGCNAPFVLRKSAEREGMRRIVGAAYVHGIMNGEVIEEGAEFEPVSIH